MAKGTMAGSRGRGARRWAGLGFAAAAAGLALLVSAPGGSLAAQEAEKGAEAGAAPAKTLQDAGTLLRSQDYAGATSILEAITAREPNNARAWAMLGFARHAAGDYEGALPAHLKAASFPQTAPTGMYNAGVAYARLGRFDEAFEWLRKAKATGRVNMTQLGLDPDAESLRADPRYAELLPTEEEYAHPFVEDVKILREWRGEAAADQFGWIARNIGDVDGDGVNDVTTSAPSHGENGSSAGKVYAYSGGSGDLLWSREGEAGDQLGLGIEAAGDVNADGVPDVAAGAPGGGRALVLSGDDGRVLLELRGEAGGDAFGRKVSDVGDVNADGHDDVIVGAPENDAAGEAAGAAYVYSGADGSVLLTLRGERAGDRFGSSAAGVVRNGELLLVVGAPGAGSNRGGRTYVYRGLGPDPAFVIEADDTGASLGGMFVSIVGDVDADGEPDVYASDWPNNAKGRSTGRIYVRSGATGKPLLTLTGEAAGDGFGIGPADAGDVDGDGHDDLVIGAWQQAGAAPSGGKVYVYSGRDGSLLETITGRVPGETFGFDATGMGDVDGDGAIDFLLTSAWSSVNGPRSGRMFIVSGRLSE
ncbi:MAG: FG-GAP-like repeat-containing protein [Gemmatimonadota bacterium]